MSIIYSYPEQGALNANDLLIGTSAEKVGGKQKNITRNFSVQQIADFINGGTGFIDPVASDFQIPVFNQSGTKITGSIMSQDIYPNGTGITISGSLATTGNISTAANLYATGVVSLGSNQNLISLNSQTRLNGPILDTTGTIGSLNQILLSDSTGVVRWQDYEAGLTYEGTWDATNNTTNGLSNSPALLSGQGVSGHFYIVNVAGSADLDGNNDWHVGDWAVFLDQGGQPASWQKIDNTSTLVGSGTAGVFAKWTDATTLNDSLMSQSGTNILIDGGLKVKDTVEATTTNSNLKLKGNGTGGVEIMSADGITDGKIKLNCSQNSHGVTIQSPPHASSATYTLVLPTDAGTAGQTLTSGGINSSQLTWTTPTASPATGTGSTNTLTLWSDGQAGVLGDSILDQLSAGGVFGDSYLNIKGVLGGLSVEGSLQLDRSIYDGGAGGSVSSSPGTNGQVLTSSTQGVAPNQHQEVKWVDPTTIGDIYTFGSSTDPIVPANVRLDLDATTGSDSFVTLIGSGVAIAQANDTVTFTVPAGDTYDLGSGVSTVTDSIEIQLTSGSTTDNSAITLTGAGGLTVAQANDVVTLTAPAGSDTTYTLAAGVKSSNSVPLNLSPSTGSDTTVNLTEGTGITLTQTSATEITIEGTAQGVTGSGTVNQLPKFGTTTSLTDSLVSETIGVGVTTEVNIAAQLDMTTHQIKNVVDPTESQDAVTKIYVDTAIGGTSQAPDVVQATTITPLPGLFWSNNNVGTSWYPVVDGFNSVAGGFPEVIDLSTTGWRAITPGIEFKFGIPNPYNQNSGAPARTLQEVNDQADALRAAIRWPAAGITTTATDITFTLSFNGGQSIVVTQPAGALGANTNSTYPAQPYQEAVVTIGTNSNPITWGTGSGTITSFSTEPSAPPADYDSYAIPVNAVSAVYIEAPLLLQNNTISSVADPTQAQDAATRNYVDNIDTGVTSVATANADLITIAGTGSGPYTGAVTATANTAAVTTAGVNLATGAQIQTAIDNSIADYLPLGGGTMTGEIDMGSDKIINVTNPTLAQDAATKGYVDSAVSGSGSLIYQGGYNAVTNTPNLTSGTGILQGWTYAVTAGPSTAFWSPALNVGDLVIANIDTPTSSTDWTEIQSNVGFAGSGTTDIATVKGLAGFNSNDFDVSADGWVEAKDFSGTTPGYVPNATSAAAGTFLKKDGTWAATPNNLAGGYLPLAGGTMTGNTIHNDNVKSIYGTSSDLEIYHDGSHNYIESITGDLIIDSQADDLILKAADDFNLYVQGTDLAIQALGNGKVGLRYDNVEKLATTSTGVSVTGNGVFSGGLSGTTGTLTGALTGTSATFTGNVTTTGDITLGDDLNFATNGFADINNSGTGAIRIRPSGTTTALTLNATSSSFSGSLGVGMTTVPNYKLHVEDVSPIIAAQSTGANNTRLLLSAENDAVYIGSTYSTSNMPMYFTQAGTSGGVKIMTIAASGNVGIGTTNPLEKLYVNASSGDARIGLNAVSGSDTEIKFSNAGVVQYSIGHDDSTDNFVIGTANVDTAKVSISKAGNVGIGTSIPGAKLEVKDSSTNIQMRVGSLTAGISPFIRLQGKNTASTTNYYADISLDAENGKLTFNDPGTSGGSVGQNPMVLDSAGNVGIGTTSPSATLQVGEATNITGALSAKAKIVVDAANNTDINNVLNLISKHNGSPSATADSGPALLFSGGIADAQTRTYAKIVGKYRGSNMGGLAFHTQDTADIITEKMTILPSSGNVGIGNISPNYSLDIAKSTGSAYMRLARNFASSESNILFGAESARNFIQSRAGTGNGAQRIDFLIGSTQRLSLGTAGQIGLSSTNYGTDGQVLTSKGSGAAAVWQAAASGLPTKTVNSFTGTGQSFINLTVIASTKDYIDMYIDGVYQQKATYDIATVSGVSRLTLASSATFPTGVGIETVTTT